MKPDQPSQARSEVFSDTLLGSGNLNLQIPLLHVPGRGGAAHDLTLSYNSNFWVYETQTANGTFNGSWTAGDIPPENHVALPGWSLFDSHVSGASLVIAATSGTDKIVCTGNYYVESPNGATDSFKNVKTNCNLVIPGHGQTPDPSHNIYTGSTAGYTIDAKAGVVRAPDGTEILFNPESFGTPTTVEDRNGNQLVQPYSYSATSSGQTINYTDDNGPQAVTLTYGPTPTGTTPLSFPCALPDHDTVFYPSDAGGTSLQSITLANKTQYTFEYDLYGELVKVTYPAGGYTRYAWTTECPPATAFQLLDKVTSDNGVALGNNLPGRYPTAKYACTSSTGICSPSQEQETDYTWTWTSTPTSNPREFTITSSTVKTTESPSSPTPRITTATFNGDATSGYGLSGVKALDSSKTIASGGTILETVSETHPTSASGYPEVQTVTTIGGASATVVKVYGDPFVTVYYPSEIIESGFDGKVARDTKTSYWSNAFNYLGQPSQVQVYDGGNHLFSQTNYGIDEPTYPLQDEPGAINHDPNFGTSYAARGNVTSIANLLTGGTSPVIRSQFDILGNVVAQYDPRQNKASYSFADNFGSAVACAPLAGHSTYAYPTLITNALGQQGKLAYYSCSGLLQSTQGPNDIAEGRTGIVYHYDEMQNLTETDYPDAGKATLSYGGYAKPLTVTSAVLATPNPAISASVAYDGLARPLLNSLPGGSHSAKGYDQYGRVCAASNPSATAPPAAGLACSASQNPSQSGTDGITYYSYDALGRKTSQIQQDNSTQSWKYNGNIVTFTDETGNQWQRTSDALGRLTSVLEPSATSPTPTLETDYQYDALNNLTRVDQWGGTKGNTGDRVRTFTYNSLSRLITSSNPETGTICYGQRSGGSCVSGYDANGNLVWKTDARSITTNYSYDALNRVTQKTYSDGTPAAHFIYDASTADFGQGAIVATPLSIGRLSSQYVGNSPRDVAVKSFSYDSMGRENGDTQCWGTQCSMTNGLLTTDHQYDLAGNVVVLGNSTQSWYNFNYDGAGRLKSVDYTLHDWTAGTFPTWNLANSATYTAGGQLLTLDGSQIWTYDNRMRVHSYQVKWGWVQPDVIKYGYTLTPLANGNIQTQVETTPQGTTTWQYTYDNLNRLSTAVNSALQTGCQENYDNWGNRTSQVAYGGSNYSCTQPITPSSGTSNRIDGYCYDAAGNVLNEGPCSSGAQKYAYDAENRLISSEYGANTYAYGADGQRVTKVSSEGTFHYVRDLDGSVMVDYKDNSAYGQGQYSKFNGQTLARISNYDTTASTDITWSFNDWLGTTRLRLAMNGLIPPRGEYSSLPFGDALTTTAGIDGDPHHFTGKERDTESNLDYFGARYYNSLAGRFMTPDPKALAASNLSNPQTWNEYAYVQNNPLSMVDPNGTCGEITAGIHQSPTSPSGQALIALASEFGANVAFPYAGQSRLGSILSIDAAAFGANGAATQTASAALNATYADSKENNTGVFSLGFSGGAQANVSAGLTSIGQNAFQGNAAFYDPGLGLGYSSDIPGVQDYVGSGLTSSLVNDISGGYPTGAIDIPGCGHDVSCAINNSDLRDKLAAAGPCNNPRVFVRHGPDLPLRFYLPFLVSPDPLWWLRILEQQPRPPLTPRDPEAHVPVFIG